MNKTPITIWVSIKEPAIENGKIVIKKGEFFYNGNKYLIENGKIYTEAKDINNVEMPE